ncbi:269_t:CDS:2, partial [Racocetra persica]
KDIAEKLGTIATVSQLRRISSGDFHIAQALKLAECKNPIEEGKEIKVKEGSNFRGYRYSYGPTNWTIYYLCPQCFQQYQEEIKAQREKNWQQ